MTASSKQAIFFKPKQFNGLQPARIIEDFPFRYIASLYRLVICCCIRPQFGRKVSFICLRLRLAVMVLFFASRLLVAASRTLARYGLEIPAELDRILTKALEKNRRNSSNRVFSLPGFTSVHSLTTVGLLCALGPGSAARRASCHSGGLL